MLIGITASHERVQYSNCSKCEILPKINKYKILEHYSDVEESVYPYELPMNCVQKAGLVQYIALKINPTFADQILHVNYQARF